MPYPGVLKFICIWRVMKKEWYILIEGKKEGPYSIGQLRLHPKFTPDTLVWKEGFLNWVPAGQIKELDNAFKDEKKELQVGFKQVEDNLRLTEVILTARLNPFFIAWWFFIILIVLLYSFYRLYFSR
jgi:hypothetical protein